MPAARAASSREAPSSTRARASIRREAAVSRHRLASRRSPTAPGSFRAIATVMTPPPIGHTADQPRRAPRGSGRDDASAIRAVGITGPSAGSGGLLCEGLDERAAVMIAQPLPKLLAGELAVGLDHGPLAVRPAGLDRVQPRALARQAADQQPAAAVALDPAVVGRDPGPHLAADVPGGVVPDQDQ